MFLCLSGHQKWSQIQLRQQTEQTTTPTHGVTIATPTRTKETVATVTTEEGQLIDIDGLSLSDTATNEQDGFHLVSDALIMPDEYESHWSSLSV